MSTGLDLLGDGGTITLTDGTRVPLRYSFRALALLEARYGSLEAVDTAISGSGSGAAFGPCIQLVGAGTVGPGGFEPHYREHQDAKGERRISGDIVYRRRTDGADLADLLHPGRLGEYIAAFHSAFSKAIEGNDEAPTNGATPAAVASPGPTATTSLLPSSTSSPAPSGT